MKLNPKYILREVAGETLLISLEDISSPKRILCLNELGKDIYALLQSGAEKEEMIHTLLSQYEVEETVLCADMDAFLDTLARYRVIINDLSKSE